MCGITGLFSPDHEDFALFAAMTQALFHRGPDAGGAFREEGMALGHRRLTIIDLSSSGNQPLFNEDGSLVLVANGEIYNYRQLTAGLKERGHRFVSDSDCEVLLHLYEELGERLLDGVNGMFAFALWDRRAGQLVAAVDRFGKKPFYYGEQGPRFLFASEMHTLLRFPWMTREVDPVAVEHYLAFRHVPAPRTIFKSFKKLQPAHMLVRREGRIRIFRYWHPAPSPGSSYGPETVDRFEELFDDAVRLRLQSDVPLGLYLSGGVDSAAVAASMSRQMSGKKISFSVGFDYRYNEHPRARQVADFLGFEFNPITVEGDLFHTLPEMVYHLDEPFGDLLSLPSWILAREAKKKLSVVLTGDGADEIFNGYFHQRLMMLRQRHEPLFSTPGMRSALTWLTRLAPAALIDRFFDYPDRFGPREKLKLVQSLRHAGRFGDFYEHITACLTPEDKMAAILPEFRQQWDDVPLAQCFERDLDDGDGFEFISRISLLDVKYWIPFSVLFRLDKLNMAHAVENRSPFLDYRLVEFALNLPREAKFNRSRNKEVLRAMIERRFPEHLREKGKQAFYMPLTTAMRSHFLLWCHDLLNKESMANRGIFQWTYLEALFRWFSHGSMLAYRQLVAIAMLELWFKVFIDDARPWESHAS
ncbi:MAG: asparagine synthase (glutamine-hydrolyzing) [Magnetococcales bacterium]|nr:asparagine synthase (glutamine-hydrolyzing) [Magnetococcales bacterium]